MSSENFEQIVLAFQPEATFSTGHEYFSNYGEVLRVGNLEAAFKANQGNFFGCGGTCLDISNAWASIEAQTGFTWSQAITLVISAEMCSLEHIGASHVQMAWMRVLATQGKVLNWVLSKYYAKLAA